MSNLLKLSNKIGPDFNSDNFYTDTVEVDFTFHINKATVLRFDEDLAQSINFPALAYNAFIQNNKLIYPFVENEKFKDVESIFQSHILVYPFTASTRSSNAIVATNIHLTITIN